MHVENYVPFKIDELCKKYNISRYKLSQMTGISQSVLTNIVNSNTLPTLITLEKICCAFDITLAQFFSTDNSLLNLTDEQNELLDLWTMLNLEEKRFVKTCIQSLKNKE